jgi:hypothetical protein
MSICVGVNQYFNPNGRWKALRSATQSVHSIVWKFRARIDIFEYDQNNPHAAMALFHSTIDKASPVFQRHHCAFDFNFNNRVCQNVTDFTLPQVMTDLTSSGLPLRC